MKKSICSLLPGFLSVTVAIYMLCIPFALTVHANDANQTDSLQSPSSSLIINKENMASLAKGYYEHHKNDANDNLPPLQEVKFFANELGLDAQNDIFTLILEKDTIALVQVMHDDISYHISLIRPDQKHSWIVSSID